jgi:hypothetical protein
MNVARVILLGALLGLGGCGRGNGLPSSSFYLLITEDGWLCLAGEYAYG